MSDQTPTRVDDATVAAGVSPKAPPTIPATTLPSWRRIFLVAMLLPIGVALSIYFFFNNPAPIRGARFAFQNDGLRWFYPWATLVTAALSWCAGRYLYPAWLRWLLFGWCLVLLDVLTFAAIYGHGMTVGTSYLLFSAQINLLTFWAILGSSPWQVRLPTVLVAAAFMFAMCTRASFFWTGEAWSLVMMVTPIVGGLLCIGLRLLRFQVRPTQSAAPGNSNDSLEAHQFSLRHVFFWGTAAVPLLLVVRNLDLLFFLRWIDGESAFATALLSVGIATINLIAIWAVLGGGRPIARLVAFIAVPLICAAVMTVYSEYVHMLYSTWAGIPILDAMIEMRNAWFPWFLTSEALLAALLLFLRASGQRLIRTPRTRPLAA